jgi:hypothetical protein
MMEVASVSGAESPFPVSVFRIHKKTDPLEMEWPGTYKS